MAELKNIRIAVSGLYDYAYEELPSLRLDMPGMGAPSFVEKKRIYKVYRPANVLSAACDKFKLLPLTHHHPSSPVDGQNFRDLAIGYTGENPWVDYLKDKDEVGIRSSVLLYDDEAFDAYERGERQLSPGYMADFKWVENGVTPKGEPYDIIMTAITNVNHLALLPAGRGGEDAVVMDKAPSIFDLVKQTNDTKYNPGDISVKTGLQKQNNGTWREPDDGYPEHNYSEYKGQGQKAVNFIIKNKGGQVKGAFNREGLGDIDIVWGEVTDPEEHQGYGLSHIIDKHGDEAAAKLGDIVENGTLDNPVKGRASIEKDGFRVAIRKTWDGKDKTWIVTGFKKEGNNSTPSSVKDYTAETSLQPNENVTQDDKKSKQTDCYMSIFDRVKGTVFDLYR